MATQLSPADYVEALRSRARTAERDVIEALQLYFGTSPRVSWMRRDARSALLRLRDAERIYHCEWTKFCRAESARRSAEIRLAA